MMTGFFAFVRDRVDLSVLRPTGFKILLEILVSQPLRIAEVPFEFASRHAGSSKASLRQGMRFLAQLAHLRFGLMSGFAVIGAIGIVVNALIVWALTSVGMDWLPAAIIATHLPLLVSGGAGRPPRMLALG